MESMGTECRMLVCSTVSYQCATGGCMVDGNQVSLGQLSSKLSVPGIRMSV